MRKNIKNVIDHFNRGERTSEKSCSTDGRVIYSYAMPIAVRTSAGDVFYIEYSAAPSNTTRTQVSAVSTIEGAKELTRMELQSLARLPIHAGY